VAGRALGRNADLYGHKRGRWFGRDIKRRDRGVAFWVRLRDSAVLRRGSTMRSTMSGPGRSPDPAAEFRVGTCFPDECHVW
jgi:hypothetical protein